VISSAVIRSCGYYPASSIVIDLTCWGKLVAAPKKARKLVFSDPFIFPYEEQILQVRTDSELAGKLTEAAVATHYRRLYPTYYIKGAGEVDIAYVDDGRFWPIEVK